VRALLSIKFHPDQANRARIEKILAALEGQGIQAMCVVSDLEDWGQRHYSPAELMRLTFAEVVACDVLVVDLAEKGVGVGIEAGYAYACGKPVVVIAPLGADVSNTLAGIARQVLRYHEDLSNLPDLLRELAVLDPGST
jgi:2'-deoxynucleoside 5'-phosphate N-hydrolase